MLQYDIPGCRFLDLFSGSGAIGIEALSRGASFACFVDDNRGAVSVIRENLKFTHLEAEARVLQMDARAAVKALDGEAPFNIIFMDPPYNKDLEKEALQAMSDVHCVNENTLFVVEASLDTNFDWLEESGYTCTRVKKYKTNKHLFLRRRRGTDE